MERIIVLVTALWQEREACNFILSHESQSESQLRTTGSSSLVVAQYISAEPQADVLLSSNSRFPPAHRLPRGQHNVSTTTWAASCMFSNSADIFSHETRVWSVEPNRSESISYLSQLAVTWWGMENPFHSLGFFLNPLNSTHRMCGGCGFLFCFFLGISVVRALCLLIDRPGCSQTSYSSLRSVTKTMYSFSTASNSCCAITSVFMKSTTLPLRFTAPSCGVKTILHSSSCRNTAALCQTHRLQWRNRSARGTYRQ